MAATFDHVFVVYKNLLDSILNGLSSAFDGNVKKWYVYS